MVADVAGVVGSEEAGDIKLENEVAGKAKADEVAGDIDGAEASGTALLNV